MGFRESLFVPSGAVCAVCGPRAGWTACDGDCRAARAAFCRAVRRGFDGFPASTVTAGSTDCCDELLAVWASAITLDAVAATQASPTLHLQVDEKSELLPKSKTIVLESIDDIPQHSASLGRLIVPQSLVPSSEVQFREIQIFLDALLIDQALDARKFGHSLSRSNDV
ncbi:hypothetical protein [Bradyrhizobium sp. 5.13L]